MKQLIIFFIFFCQICYSIDTTNILPEDKQTLEQFFKFLITRTSLGYTLSGDKPCSIESCPSFSRIPPRIALNVFLKHPSYSILLRGWEIWTKYSDHYTSRNFVFRFVPEYGTIILINKTATRTIIGDNVDLFQKYSHSNLTVEDFLRQVCYPSDSNEDYLIKKHTVLLGILLGYGRNNSLAYAQGGDLQNLRKMKFFLNGDILKTITYPGFLCIQNGTNTIENMKIKKTLLIANKNLREDFKEEKYFETFIKLFTK